MGNYWQNELQSSSMPMILKPPNPPAGSAFSYTFTQQFKLVVIRYVLATSAVAATRFPIAIIDDGAVTLWDNLDTTGVAASLTQAHTLYNGAGGAGNANATYQASMPLFSVSAGWRFRITVGSMDAADQLSQVYITGYNSS